jgi:hypothetical protein
MADVRAANKVIGHYWFDRSSMKFFKTRIMSRLIGGKYFITRETAPSNQTRFSVRRANDDGSINTVGEFHSYLFREDAKDAINQLIKGGN